MLFCKILWILLKVSVHSTFTFGCLPNVQPYDWNHRMICLSWSDNRCPNVMSFNVPGCIMHMLHWCHQVVGISRSDTNSCASSISHFIIRMGISPNLAMFRSIILGSGSLVLSSWSSIAQVVVYGIIQPVGVGNLLMGWCVDVLLYTSVWICENKPY